MWRFLVFLFLVCVAHPVILMNFTDQELCKFSWLRKVSLRRNVTC